MTMYRQILAVVGVVLVVAAVGGFFLLKSAPAPSTWADRAQVTGYATSGMRGHTSGAVSVNLDGASAARIDTIVQGLPRANLQYICAENAQEYHITFSADAGKGVKQGFALTGYWCNNLVVEVPLHGLTEDRIDRDCTLLSAVRRLLPASAIATHSGTCAHASGRLFLAVSRHKTATPKTPTHGTVTHKTPAYETPAHKTATYKTPAYKTPAHKASTHGTVTHKAPAPARKSPARKSPAHKSPAHKSPAHKSPAHKSPRRKSPRRKSPRRESPKPRTVKQRTAEHRSAEHGSAEHRIVKPRTVNQGSLQHGSLEQKTPSARG